MRLLFASALLYTTAQAANAFVIPRQTHRAFIKITTQPSILEAPTPTFLPARSSTVVDEDGPTPDMQQNSVDVVDNDDIPELKYDATVHPVPHQPWRRGTTNGCHDPIEAQWRMQADQTIRKAVKMVGGDILDVTWYLTQLVVHIDHTTLDRVDDYSRGPEIVTLPDDDGPEYFDPEDPTPEPIWADEEDYLFERDVDSEQQWKASLYARKEDDDDDDDLEQEMARDSRHPSSLLEQESRQDMAAMTDEEEARLENMEQAVTSDVLHVNTAALSTIARSILESLETVEDELQVLERHEVILAEPNGLPYLLETQREFDAQRGNNVMVETQDPFGSNRILKGKLMDRNAMDVIINKKGRMVTIPLNFVKCVRLPFHGGQRSSDEYDDDLEEEEL